MELSPEYIKRCNQQVLENLKNKEFVLGPKRFSQRVKRILEFLEKHREKDNLILDIGSGAYMPIHLGATHAIDASPIPGHILKETGWDGHFETASCDELPFRRNLFDIAICSEVIEHLPDLKTVINTILEMERVSTKWILTTPRASKSGFRDVWNTEPTHVQFFTPDDIRGLIEGLPAKVEEEDKHIYVVRE